MQNKDNILPVGGMNADDDPRFFEKGDYLEAGNIQIGSNQDQGDFGLVQTLRSTKDTSFPSLSTENWTYAVEELGKAVDKKNNKVYVLSYIKDIYNFDEQGVEPDLFVIYKHDLVTGVISVIFQQRASAWNLSKWDSSMTKFYNPVIVDNNLIWTDNVNDIRMIDVNRMEVSYGTGITTAVFWDGNVAYINGYNQGDYIYYQEKVYLVLQNTSGVDIVPIEDPAYYEYKCLILDCYLDVSDPNNFVLAALPPLIAATPIYGTDPFRAINQLRGRVFQFSYRYIYIDWRKSTFAPPSIIAPPNNEENTSGVPDPNTALNNLINITINTGNEEVRAIEIIVRDSDDISVWYQINKINLFNENGWRLYSAHNNITFPFYNDFSKIAIDRTLVYTLFSYVPIKAKHMELIEGNRLVFGNITEGYGNIYNNVTLSLSWVDLGFIGVSKTNFLFEFEREPSQTMPAGWEDWQIRITIPTFTPQTNGSFVLRFKLSTDNDWRQISHDYIVGDAYPSSVKSALVTLFIAEWGVDNTDVCYRPTDYSSCVFPRTRYRLNAYSVYADMEWDGYFITSGADTVEKYPVLKVGSNHSWGIVYRDKVGRISPIVGGGEIVKYIPFYTEDNAIESSFLPVIDININHTPPSWSESYEIVYAGNKSISWFLSLFGYEMTYGKIDHDDPDDEGSEGSQSYRIKIAESQQNARNFWDNWSVEEYVWEKGDRIRIIGRYSSNNLIELEGGIWDTEIAGVYTDTDWENWDSETEEILQTWVYFKTSSAIDLSSYISAKESIYFEIYRPAKELSTELFFTTGMTFEIETDLYGNKYHKGNTNQVLNTSGSSISPAIVRNTAHDAWKYIRNFRNDEGAESVAFWAESQYASDWYITQKLTSSGTPIPDLDSLQQNILTKRYRHGGQVSIGSQTNNIAKFDFDDFDDLKDEHGDIEGLRMIGFVLKTIQQSKVSSVFINRQESYNAAGDSDYQLINKVFGSVRPSLENWGTDHPDSVEVNDRHLYFWDQSEGIVVRDAPNGAIAISNKKMKRYFTDLAKTLDSEDTENQRVVFSYSKETDELFCLFGNSDASKQIITFSEKNTRWRRTIDLAFQLGVFYWIGKRLFHANNNKLSEWWRGTDYQKIGGTEREGVLTLYSNTDPAKVKTFDSIIVYQTGARPKFTSIEIPEKASAVSSLMKTYIYDVNIKEKEGVFYCQILRDINDPRPLTDNQKLMNGRRLRGLYAKVSLKFTGTDKITLSNIIVLSTPSERSQ
jgi:hypothetical protein